VKEAELMADRWSSAELVIDRPQSGRPYADRVLAVVEPHLDDMPIFAFGTVAKLLDEGYTGYLIRVSNDEHASLNLSLPDTIAAGARDTEAVAKVMGFRDVVNLYYRNHLLDQADPGELRARLMFLFRFFKVDAVFTYDPWAPYEENPDHVTVARAVEAACWMSAYRWESPEHALVGLTPHTVGERYFYARGPQLVNRVVDTAATLDRKLDAICACRTAMIQIVAEEIEALRARGIAVPWAFPPGDAEVREYARIAMLGHDRIVGARYGLEAAEEFHYVGPGMAGADDHRSLLRRHFEEAASD
jgi:LmbE family N-acetylglucosaminyl deacetylase